jgi:hypothetical protein
LLHTKRCLNSCLQDLGAIPNNVFHRFRGKACGKVQNSDSNHPKNQNLQRIAQELSSVKPFVATVKLA